MAPNTDSELNPALSFYLRYQNNSDLYMFCTNQKFLPYSFLYSSPLSYFLDAWIAAQDTNNFASGVRIWPFICRLCPTLWCTGLYPSSGQCAIRCIVVQSIKKEKQEEDWGEKKSDTTEVQKQEEVLQLLQSAEQPQIEH